MKTTVWPGDSLEFEVFDFSDGMPHVKMTKWPDSHVVQRLTVRCTTLRDLLVLHEMASVMFRNGIVVKELFLTSLLGSRMDRRLSRYEPSTYRIVCQQVADINRELGGGLITLLDPHSQITVQALDAEVFTSAMYVEKALEHMKAVLGTQSRPLLVAPDVGASKKVEALGELFKLRLVQGYKHRDQATGELSKFGVYGSSGAFYGQDVLIVDDLCDGGRTFEGLADELKTQGVGHISLYVTHGIFSKGLPLLDIDHIYTTNSMFPTGEMSALDANTPYVTRFNIPNLNPV